MPFCDQMAAAIDGARTDAALNELSAAIWKGLVAGSLQEEEAQLLAERIHARKIVAKAPQRPVQRRLGSRPRTPGSMARRRSWAASGRLPPRLAAMFTLAEQAVLSVVAVQVEQAGVCAYTLDHIGALAGVCRSTVRNALREAQRLGLVRIEERRLTAWRNAPNRVTIVSPEWQTWMRLRSKGGGSKSVFPTSTNSYREKSGMARIGKPEASRDGKGQRFGRTRL